MNDNTQSATVWHEHKSKLDISIKLLTGMEMMLTKTNCRQDHLSHGDKTMITGY